MKYKTTIEESSQNFPIVLPSLLVVLIFYLLLVSAGSGRQAGTTTYYYADLAEAFVNGNLHLSTAPDPSLLALENPYNLGARIELARTGIEIPVDLSLYDGKFYIYWGPAPALILAGFHLFYRQPIGDLFLALAFGMGLFLAQSLLLFFLWKRYFFVLPLWTLHLAILLSGLSLPIVLLRHYDDHARVYEAAIAGGQFFLLSGVLMAFTAIDRPSISKVGLASAGLLWALAIGSRHILAPAICFMIILTALWLIRTNDGLTAKAMHLVSLGLPFAVGCAALAWYNWARFGAVTETGFSYALAGVDLEIHASEFFSETYIIQNLYNYLLHPPEYLDMFPFVAMLKGSENSVLPFYVVPQFYYAQPITGVLYLFPFAIFAVMLLTRWMPKLLSRSSAANSSEDNEHQILTWIALSLSSSFFVAFCLLMVFFWAAMRYLGDFLPVLTVLSALGFWQGYRSQSQNTSVKNRYALIGIILASVSLLINTLLAISTI